jgi:signal transduction histidine kinase
MTQDSQAKTRKRILLLGIASGVIALLLAFLTLGFFEFYKIKQEAINKLDSQSEMLIYGVAPALMFEDKEGANKALESLSNDQSINRVRIYNTKGQEFTSFIVLDKEGDIYFKKDIIYQNEKIGRLEIDARYMGLKDRFMHYILIVVIIFILSIPITFILSAPLRNQVSQAVGLLSETTASLERSNRELETLLYIVSHDLKEPLRSIEYFSTSVKEDCFDKLDEKGKDYFDRVILAASRMRLLLDDILMMSRARRMKPPDEMVNGENIINEALARLEGKIKQVHAKITIAKEFPVYKVERIWATQAILNLIANALKFTNEGQAPNIEITPYNEKGQTGIMVADRGPGVPPEFTKKIFELFQRAVDRKIEGTGAGLAIVLEVAHRHNGDAWVQPREGGGSEFIITFAKE